MSKNTAVFLFSVLLVIFLPANADDGLLSTDKQAEEQAVQGKQAEKKGKTEKEKNHGEVVEKSAEEAEYVETKKIDAFGLNHPRSSKEFAAMLSERVPHLIVKRCQKNKIIKEPYLWLKCELDVSEVFKVLKEVYKEMIMCDMETILFVAQRRHKYLLLADLFEFIEARKSMKGSASADHPYWRKMRELLKVQGREVVLPMQDDITLEEIMTEPGREAVIQVKQHIALVMRVSDENYVYSTWNDEKSAYLLEHIKSEESGFYDEDGNMYKIRAYMLLPLYNH